MKKLLLLLILLTRLCFVPSLMAQDNPNSASPEAKSPPSSEENERNKSNPVPVVWPKPFTPSEEIGADSQISFPTDI